MERNNARFGRNAGGSNKVTVLTKRLFATRDVMRNFGCVCTPDICHAAKVFVNARNFDSLGAEKGVNF